MNYKKLTAVFMALGIAATCFSGCGLTEGNGGTSASEPTKAAVQQHRRIQLRQLQKPQQHQNLRKQLRRQAQGLSPAIQETHLQKRKKKLHINGVLTDSDEDSVTIEYGSDGDFNQTTFDISNADIQIGETRNRGDLSGKSES